MVTMEQLEALIEEEYRLADVEQDYRLHVGITLTIANAKGLITDAELNREREISELYTHRYHAVSRGNRKIFREHFNTLANEHFNTLANKEEGR